MLKGLLFDFGGTLDSDGLTWPERFLRLCREEGLPGTRQEQLDAFYRSDESLTGRPDLSGLDLAGTVSLQVEGSMKRLGAPAAAGARIAGAFVRESRETLARNRRLLERLAGRFALGVVSNFYGNLEGLLAAEGLGHLFQVVADSASVGAIKPDPGIFHHALRALRIEAGEAMMVGDSLERDMRGAERLGMPHAFLSPSRAACCPEARMLAQFSDLETLLSPAAQAHGR